VCGWSVLSLFSFWFAGNKWECNISDMGSNGVLCCNGQLSPSALDVTWVGHLSHGRSAYLCPRFTVSRLVVSLFVGFDCLSEDAGACMKRGRRRASVVVREDTQEPRTKCTGNSGRAGARLSWSAHSKALQTEGGPSVLVFDGRV